MLQFIAETNDKYTLAEQAQMAIEGGCQWIILRVPDLSDGEVRELAADLVPLCKETSTMLTIEDRIELARELGLHGVQLSLGSRPAAAVREELGPEAIVGVEVGIASAALAMQGLDVDYVSFPSYITLERLGEEIEALRGANFTLPIVAANAFTPVDASCAIDLGASGVAVGRPIGFAADPVSETEAFIEALKK